MLDVAGMLPLPANRPIYLHRHTRKVVAWTEQQGPATQQNSYYLMAFSIAYGGKDFSLQPTHQAMHRATFATAPAAMMVCVAVAVCMKTRFFISLCKHQYYSGVVFGGKARVYAA